MDDTTVKNSLTKIKRYPGSPSFTGRTGQWQPEIWTQVRSLLYISVAAQENLYTIRGGNQRTNIIPFYSILSIRYQIPLNFDRKFQNINKISKILSLKIRRGWLLSEYREIFQSKTTNWSAVLQVYWNNTTVLLQVPWLLKGKHLKSNYVVPIQALLAANTTSAVLRLFTRSAARLRPRYLRTAVLRTSQCVKMDNVTEHVIIKWLKESLLLRLFPYLK